MCHSKTKNNQQYGDRAARGHWGRRGWGQCRKNKDGEKGLGETKEVAQGAQASDNVVQETGKKDMPPPRYSFQQGKGLADEKPKLEE
jgi:hypothetical protein